jgi:hypothetical protein
MGPIPGLAGLETKDWELNEWVVSHKVRWAVHGFKAYKSPEDDKIFLTVLQKDLVVIMSSVMKIL